MTPAELRDENNPLHVSPSTQNALDENAGKHNALNIQYTQIPQMIKKNSSSVQTNSNILVVREEDLDAKLAEAPADTPTKM